MSDAALQPRLDAIERRQRYILVLLVYPYLAAITWAATRRLALAVAIPATGIVVVAYLVALYRGRTSSGADETDEPSPASER